VRESLPVGAPWASGNLETPEAPRILDRLPDAVVAVERSGRVVWANRVYLETFGWSLEAVRGASAVDSIVGPLAEQGDGGRLLELIDAGLGDVELIALTRDGLSIPVLVRVTPLDGHQRLLTLTDISEIHRLRADLVTRCDASRNERHLLDELAESFRAPVLIADDAQRLVQANEPARELLGGDGAVVLGRPIAEIALPPAIRGAWLSFLSSGHSRERKSVRALIGGVRRGLELRLAQVRAGAEPVGGSLLVLAELPEEVPGQS
jgi:PAS domain S-box-containing protein